MSIVTTCVNSSEENGHRHLTKKTPSVGGQFNKRTRFSGICSILKKKCRTEYTWGHHKRVPLVETIPTNPNTRAFRSFFDNVIIGGCGKTTLVYQFPRGYGWDPVRIRICGSRSLIDIGKYNFLRKRTCHPYWVHLGLYKATIGVHEPGNGLIRFVSPRRIQRAHDRSKMATGSPPFDDVAGVAG